MIPLSRWARRSKTVRSLARPLLRARRFLSDPGRGPREATWERLSTLLADDPLVRVEEFGGVFRLDPRSHILKRLLVDGEYEPELARLCRTLVRPDHDAVDIGANAGFFSVLLAQSLPAQRVLAVEPSRPMATRLRYNLERNGVDARVVVFEGAASDRRGTAELRGVEGKEEYGTIGVLAHPAAEVAAQEPGAAVYSDVVAAEPLDALVERHRLRPGFIKIDTEGAEMRVFHGARETLRAFTPIVISELDDVLLRANGGSAMEVVSLLRGLGYRVLDPFTAGHPAVTREQLETPHALNEVLCIPESAAR